MEDDESEFGLRFRHERRKIVSCEPIAVCATNLSLSDLSDVELEPISGWLTRTP